MFNGEAKQTPHEGIYQKVYLPHSCYAKEKDKDKEKEKEKENVKYTVWTNEMDSCLTKILVAQIKSGNKKDGVLKHAAYMAAVSYINKKFSLDLTKDHIKNRLKTWKKQFKILKELLMHKDFKWDGDQKMVVADNSVWNNYIKVHPDVRRFRARVIENYDDLSFIIGNDPLISSYPDNNTEIDVDYVCNQNGKGSANALEFQNEGLPSKQLRWTEEMDCSLSEILVEKMRKGLKMDYILCGKGCDTVLSALNEKFGPKFTKAHIESRLRTWKTQYGIVKKVLSHAGFQWDETRRRIIANDSVWIDYVKRNPDAAQLQGRVINNYNELSIIFGCDHLPEGSLRGAYSDFNFVAESCTVGSEDIFCNHSDSAKEKGKYISWTDEMDTCLIQLLLEQVLLGNKLEKSFKAAAYTAALDALNKKFALDLSKDNIKNRLKTWRKQYGYVKELLSHSGFEWDEKQKMVVASDSKWQEYIKKNPDIRQLRAKPIQNFNELRIIVGNEPQSANWSGISTRVVADPVQNNEDHAQTPSHLLDNNKMNHDPAADGIQESFQQTRSRPSSSHSKQPCKRRHVDDSIQESSQQTGSGPSSSQSKQPHKTRRVEDVVVNLMSAIATNIGRIADALTENNNNVCLREVFEMVRSIPGFDDDLIIDACEYLSSDDNRARMFMKLDDRLRKMWLLKRLRSQVS